jgi:excisionase family DNA binding protein
MGASVDQASRLPEPLLLLPEVATALRVSVPTVRRLISRGELDAVRVGGQIRVAPEALGRVMAVEDRALDVDERTERLEPSARARHAGTDGQEGGHG